MYNNISTIIFQNTVISMILSLFFMHVRHALMKKGYKMLKREEKTT